jgi:hypothetical protein
LLSRKPHLTPHDPEIPPKAAVCNWKDFKYWLNYCQDEEKAQENHTNLEEKNRELIGIASQPGNAERQGENTELASTRPSRAERQKNEYTTEPTSGSEGKKSHYFPVIRQPDLSDSQNTPINSKTFALPTKAKKRGNSRSPLRKISLSSFFARKSNIDLTADQRNR